MDGGGGQPHAGFERRGRGDRALRGAWAIGTPGGGPGPARLTVPFGGAIAPHGDIHGLGLDPGLSAEGRIALDADLGPAAMAGDPEHVGATSG